MTTESDRLHLMEPTEQSIFFASPVALVASIAAMMGQDAPEQCTSPMRSTSRVVIRLYPEPQLPSAGVRMTAYLLLAYDWL